MKPPLLIFTRFYEELLPLEWWFVIDKLDFEDDDLAQIAREIRQALENKAHKPVFSKTIDKRKYSYFKKSVQTLLLNFDAGKTLEIIQSYEKSVLNDCITPEEEQGLLRMAQRIDNRNYHFVRFYQLILHFRQFLQIRLRRKLYPKAHAWIENYKSSYNKSLQAFDLLHQATSEVVMEYDMQSDKAGNWEQELLRLFDDEALDVMNRYAAAVRLAFLYINKGMYQKMLVLLDQVENRILRPFYLGRRVLANYYANRLIVHSKLDELEKAEHFGRLSLRTPTDDQLFYATNLSSVLLRMGQTEAAFILMKDHFEQVRQSPSFHSKLGFIAHYVHCLIDLKKFKEAESFAESYLASHETEIMANRWHLFFAAYFRSLVMQEKFARLLYIVDRKGMREKELNYAGKSHYLPTVSWYIALADFMEGDLNEALAVKQMVEVAKNLMQDPLRRERIRQQIRALYAIQPDMMKKLWSELFTDRLIL